MQNTIKTAYGCAWILAMAMGCGTTGGSNGDDNDSIDSEEQIVDDDGDGLSNEEEDALGTDPTNPDSDGDGFNDGDEIAAGTNPSYDYSHPYTGGYNVGWCDTPPEPTGPTGMAEYDYQGETFTWTVYQPGDVAENFTLVDQHGEDVSLYSFCGQHVMLSFGTVWCGPCQTLASEVQDIQDEYADAGFQAIEVLMEDAAGNIPDQQDLIDWAETYGLITIPVLKLPLSEQTSLDGLWPVYELDWGIPTTVHIGPDGTVLSVDDYITDPASFIE